jgi:RNA polymerase sigma-70 factor, ECF subfamily
MRTLWPVSDAELVRRMLRGDEEAFDSFFVAAYPAMYRFALARLGFDRDAAAEVAQSAVCKAIASLPTFRGEAALLTWVCTICRHELYSYEKQRGRSVRVALIEDVPEVRAALESLRASEMQDLDRLLDRKKMASLVQRVLDNLPAHYADALEWKYIDEVSVREIALRLGISVKAAESLLSRARRAFGDAFRAITEPPGTIDPQEGSA